MGAKLTRDETIILIVCLVVAALAIWAGYSSPPDKTQQQTLILKDVMLFGSGAGIAYVLARLGARASTTDKVQSLCRRSVQRLALVSTQTRSASSLLRTYSSEPDENAELVATLLDNLADQTQVSIGDMEETAGIKLGLDDSVSTSYKAALNGIKAATEALPERATTADVQQLKDRLTKALEHLGDMTDSSATTPQTIKCPQCGTETNILLKDTPGSTTHTTCFSCQSRIIIHKNSANQIVCKAQPRLSTPSSVSLGTTCVVNCPQCSAAITLTIKPTDGRILVRNCFHCDERIYINAATGRIDHFDKGQPQQATYISEGQVAVISCPGCSYSVRSRIHPEHPCVKASCPRCTILIHATPSKTPPAIHTNGKATGSSDVIVNP